MVGTTIALVTDSDRTFPTQAPGSKVGRGTTRRPAYTLDRIATIPATWYGGTLTRAASSSPAPMNSTEPRM